MATIKKYQASETISPASMPQTAVRNPVNEQLQQLGSTVQNVADYYQQREEKKEDFKAENDYRRLNIQLGEDMDRAAENMAEDGTGFHAEFKDKIYGPAREQFLASLPDRLKERYGTILGDEGADTEAWMNKSAGKERDKLYGWYDNQLKIGQDELQTAISLDPEGYDTILQQGIDQIEASGLPASQKEQKRQEWTKIAQLSHLNKMLETNPERVLKDLGADPRMLTPTTQYQLLKQAVTHQESKGDPNAISPKGAIGLMQVMPGTARDISKWMGDGLLDKNMSDARVTEIMSNPVTNERYGDFYLKKMIKDYSGKGGVEAALVGYNAGPAVAQKWIESGFDNSVLPAETKKYVKNIMGNLPSTWGSQQGAKGDPSRVKFTWADRKDLASQGDESKLNQDMVGRVKTAFAGLGIDNVRINSGFRDAAENAEAGGAKGSQHKHGNAVDIDVSGYSIAERTKIIQALSAAGITGLGIGSNIIHADTGGRRAWGYASSSGGGAVPKWAQAAITEHLENRSQAPSRVGIGGRYAGLPYDQRQKYIHAADQQLTRNIAEQNKASAVQKYQLTTAMNNEIASIQQTGQSTEALDETAVSTILGEDDYIKYIDRKETANRIFSARQGITEMTLQEMDDRLNDYKPQAGSPTFANDQQVEAAVQKEIDRVTRMRARDPVQGAMLFPDVQAAWQKVSGEDDPAPEAVQEFVRLNLERQKEFGIKPGSEEPVPRPWAVQIGQQLSKIPEVQGKNAADVNASILVMYDSLQKVFGDYTDEVIINALKEYKGVGPNTAELLTGYMQAIQNGGDPLARLRQGNRALDKDQVEESSGFWSGVWDFFSGDRDDAASVDATPEASINPDMILRAMQAVENLGDDITPEQEQSLVRRFGQGTVDAARARIGGNP
jgi:hypothetical protein